MSDIYNSNLKIKIEGSSHSEEMVLTIKNFPKGYRVNRTLIDEKLSLRRPSCSFNTSRKEEDEYYFKSGISDEVSNGENLIIVVKNKNVNSSDYVKGEIRANHADYPAYVKYGEDYDYRGGGKFSGRLTVPFVILGAMIMDYLSSKGIKIGSRVKQVLDIKDDEINEFSHNIDSFNHDPFPMINKNKQQMIIDKLEKIKDDSVGGEIESYIINLPVGLGEPFFNSLESELSRMIFSIPSVKGVLFGDGIDLLNHTGSEVLDTLTIEDNKVKINANHMGGINGGLSNGNPIIIHSIFKPIASIKKTYPSINILENKNIELAIKGRHDNFILNRACVIVDSFISIVILDMLMEAK